VASNRERRLRRISGALSRNDGVKKGRFPFSRAGVIAAAGCVGAAVGIGIALAQGQSSPAFRPPAPSPFGSAATWAAHNRPAPDFTLHDQNGRLVSLHAQRSRIVLLTFLDSRCRRECPLEGRQLGLVQRALRGSSAPVILDVVSVDPWGDTPASTRRFIRETSWTLPWRWLGGRARELKPVWRHYGIEVIPGGRDISHSVALYVIDGRGFERLGYVYPFAARDVARAVRHVAGAE
jgi:cytochrome oxidase Cu insertion factor (SCO1/SenC/PrrC family)